MKEIEELLRGEIVDELIKLEEIEVGSDKYKTTVDGLTKLADRVIEMHKFEADQQEKAEKQLKAEAQIAFEQEQKIKQLKLEEEKLRVEEEFKSKQIDLEDDKVRLAKEQAEFDKSLKDKQLEEEKKDRLIKNCIAVASIAIPSLITIWGTLKSFEFEKEGTVTTIMGRGFVNKLLPKK